MAYLQYDAEAEQFANRYESLRFEEVHSNILDILPSPRATVLDVGAGSGRDAAALAAMGHDVVAAEPSERLRKIGQRIHAEKTMKWVDDRLPEMEAVQNLSTTFDFILLSAVWMHIAPSVRPEAMGTLSQLLSKKGRMAITLRLAHPDPTREIYSVSVDETIMYAEACGLHVLRSSFVQDLFGRADIRWAVVVFEKH